MRTLPRSTPDECGKIYKQGRGMIPEIKVCPKCGGPIIIRRYTERYEDYEIDPVTGQESETLYDSHGMKEHDSMMYCKYCDWESWGDKPQEESDLEVRASTEG